MRRSIKLFGLITVAAIAVSQFDHVKTALWPTDLLASSTVSEKYITLPDTEKNAKLVALRKQCGTMTHAVQELRPRIGNDDGEDVAITYLELVGDVVDSLVYDGVIPGECILATEEGWFILLSTKGDLFVGLSGRAITSHSEALRQEQNEVAESGSAWNKMRSIFKEGHG